MYKRDYLILKFLIGVTTLFFLFFTFFKVVSLSPFLKGPSLFYRNLVGSYLSVFIPINLTAWLILGYIGAIAALIFSCLSVALIALKHGIFYYKSYIVLFGVAAFIGYKIFLKRLIAKNQLLAKLETLEVDKNTVSSKTLKRQKDIEAAKGRVERYAALKDITEELSSTLQLEEVANIITQGTFDIIGRSERAFLFLIDELRQGLELFSSAFAERQAHGPLPIKAKQGEIFDGWILKQRRPLLVEDLDNDFRFSTTVLKDPIGGEFKSTIGVPLMSEKKVIGVLRLDTRQKDVYTQDDLRILSIIGDIAAVSIENSILYQRTNELAIRDGLTGLLVQRYFKERVNEELKRALAAGKKISMLMIDLDHFKECNDKYGHAAGDILLVKIAKILGEIAKEGHIVSRYGGEEFAILLFEAGKREAFKKAEEIRKGVEKTIFELRRSAVRITVSVGISSFPDDGLVADAILKKADENLYMAKQNGRNKVWPVLMKRSS